MFDYLVVGAGFAGATMAERLAADGDRKVLIVRSAIRTSAATRTTTTTRRGSSSTSTGRTSFTRTRRTIYDYLSRFTDWRPYQHRVLACVDGQLLPIPINLDTVNRMYGTEFYVIPGRRILPFRCRAARADQDVRRRDRQQGGAGAVREVLPQLHPQAVGARPVGARRGGHRPSPCANQPRRSLLHRHLSGRCRCTDTPGCSSGCSRTRTSRSCSTLTIDEVRDMIPYREMIFTGPIDEFFDYRFGKLPYRSLRIPVRDASTSRSRRRRRSSTTRTRTRTRACTEFKYLTGQEHPKTTRRLRISAGRRRSVLSGAAPGERRAVPRVPGAGGPTAGVHFIGRLGDLQVLQHGSSGGAGARPTTQGHLRRPQAVALPA